VAEITILTEQLADTLKEEFSALSARMTSPLTPAWLTISDAAKHASFSEPFIRKLIRDKKICVSGKHKAIRIYRPHLDEQIARGFPVLNFKTSFEQADEILASKPVTNYLPRPKDSEPSVPNQPRLLELD
jgi:hypothetical protein